MSKVVWSDTYGRPKELGQDSSIIGREQDKFMSDRDLSDKIGPTKSYVYDFYVTGIFQNKQ